MELALILWFFLSLLSTAYVLWDQLVNTPSMRVMTLAWVLVVLYTGPLGLFVYLLSCRQPMPGTHDQFINVHWKQAIGSEIHCVAGDATAIIVIAAFLSLVNISVGFELLFEYVGAYLFGLLIFQALFMRSMFSSYKEAVVNTVFVETVSMNFVMLGMFPVMIILGHYFPTSMHPTSLEFWGRMSLATMVGFLFAYPINSWFVRVGIKHGMMSRPQSDHEQTMSAATNHVMAKHGCGSHADKMPEHSEHSEHMQMPMLPAKKQIFWVVLSYLLLGLVLWLTNFIAPISF